MNDTAQSSLGKLKLLLVDDEPALAGFVAFAGRSCGYEIILTVNTADFCREYSAHKPDVVAIDLGIPGKDGVEILRFLAGEGCVAPIVIISGFDRRVLDAAYRLGLAFGLQMIGPISKPVRLTTLKETFSDLAARRHVD